MMQTDRPFYKVNHVEVLSNGSSTNRSVEFTPISGYDAVGIVGYTSVGSTSGAQKLYDLALADKTHIYVSWSEVLPQGYGVNAYVLHIKQ
jgi:hypothetical protein